MYYMGTWALTPLGPERLRISHLGRAEDVVIRWSSEIDGCEEYLANGGRGCLGVEVFRFRGGRCFS